MELYNSHATPQGNGTADTINDDDIYGEQTSAPAPPLTVKDENMDDAMVNGLKSEENAEAWLATCTEQGVLKVGHARVLCGTMA